MSATSPKDALARAGRRVTYHLIQATIEGLKAVEAVIEEIGTIGEDDENGSTPGDRGVQRIEIE